MLGLRTSDIKNIAIFFSFSTRLLSYGKRVYMYHLVAECCFRAGALEAFNNYFFGLCTKKPQENSRTLELAGCQQELSEICKTKTY